MRTRSKRARKCPVRERPMRKNGHDRNGRQRWQCDTCKATTTATIESRSRASTLRAFLDWLLEAAPQRRLGCDARTFRRRSAWCWDLEPRIHPDGVVHHVVMADGTYVNGWRLLTAVDGNDGEALAWQWCSREGTAAYKALFEQIAPPDVLVCDGMKGIQRACAETWPNTRIQRCLVHVQRDTRADLTGKPRLQAGRKLKRLADMLARVHEPDAAVRWGGAPDAWHGRWKRMLAERTYAKDNPDDPRAATSRADGGGPICRCAAPISDSNASSKTAHSSVSSTPSSRFSARCRVTATGSKAASTPRPNACSSTTAGFPRHTCAAPANGTAT